MGWERLREGGRGWEKVGEDVGEGVGEDGRWWEKVEERVV